MLVDEQSELMSDLLFTVHRHGGDDVTWKPPIYYSMPSNGSYQLPTDLTKDFFHFSTGKVWEEGNLILIIKKMHFIWDVSMYLVRKDQLGTLFLRLLLETGPPFCVVIRATRRSRRL